jgi:hypothetical protein
MLVKVKPISILLAKAFFSLYKYCFIFCCITMQKAELDKLLQLTAIELAPGQESVFLNYFSTMKEMFDKFREFPLPEAVEGAEEEKVIARFEQGADFAAAQAMLANVNAERLVGNAIEVKSAFGE